MSSLALATPSNPSNSSNLVELRTEGSASETESWPELKAAGRLSKVVECLGAQILRARASGEPAPRLVGRYTLHTALGRGAFGVVMAGEDAVLNRPVAIKLIPVDPSNTDYTQRVLREGRALALLDDPAVVRVFDCGVTELETRGGVVSTIYIVMEQLEGASLNVQDTRQLPLEGRLARLGAAARGLQRVHAAGLLHRDVKPANLLVTNEGRAVWVDFGLACAVESGVVPDASQGLALAKVVVPAANERLGDFKTKVAGPVGTPAYMAPEVKIGWEASAASDQWSLAAMVWEGLAGKRPTMRKGKPVLPRWWRVPRDLRKVLARAMAAMPDERLDGVGELADALEAWSPGRAARRQGRVKMVRVGVGVLVAVASLPLWAPMVRAGLVGAEGVMDGVWGWVLALVG